MNLKVMLVLAAGVAALASRGAVEWTGLDEANWYSGPKLTAEDLAGKVVLVDCWGVNCPPCKALLPRMEQIWKSFKDKKFVLIGSHRQGRSDEKVKELVAQNKLTYPIYERAGVKGGPQSRTLPFVYVVDWKGKITYAGDDERQATEALVEAIGSIGGPRIELVSRKDKSFKKLKGMTAKMKLGTNLEKVGKDLAKLSTDKDAAKAEEASRLLEKISDAKSDLRETYEAEVASKMYAEAFKHMDLYVKSFPTEGAALKDQLAELKQKAAEAAAAAKAKAKK